ncbi:MAG: hypothetical protein O6700_10055 [Gammaproteobacteria bacterium]|nr:hypothetical protein [Gammaproteobacteria bacterium]
MHKASFLCGVLVGRMYAALFGNADLLRRNPVTVFEVPLVTIWH